MDTCLYREVPTCGDTWLTVQGRCFWPQKILFCGTCVLLSVKLDLIVIRKSCCISPSLHQSHAPHEWVVTALATLFLFSSFLVFCFWSANSILCCYFDYTTPSSRTRNGSICFVLFYFFYFFIFVQLPNCPCMRIELMRQSKVSYSIWILEYEFYPLPIFLNGKKNSKERNQDLGIGGQQQNI